jgi:hypothetical protein
MQLAENEDSLSYLCDLLYYLDIESSSVSIESFVHLRNCKVFYQTMLSVFEKRQRDIHTKVTVFAFS